MSFDKYPEFTLSSPYELQKVGYPIYLCVSHENQAYNPMYDYIDGKLRIIKYIQIQLGRFKY